jgi:hypothetical protein
MLHNVLSVDALFVQENLNSLVIHVTKSFWDQLVRFEKLGSIQAFKLKYQQVETYSSVYSCILLLLLPHLNASPCLLAS